MESLPPPPFFFKNTNEQGSLSFETTAVHMKP